MEMLIFFMILIASVWCGFISHSICDQKKQPNGFLWGLFLGIIGIIVAALMPYNNQYDRENRIKCGKCGGTLNDGYTTCCHCGYDNTIDIKRNKKKQKDDAKIRLFDVFLYKIKICVGINNNLVDEIERYKQRSRIGKFLHINHLYDLKNGFCGMLHSIEKEYQNFKSYANFSFDSSGITVDYAIQELKGSEKTVLKFFEHLT